MDEQKALRDNIYLLCVSSTSYLLTLDVDVGGRILFILISFASGWSCRWREQKRKVIEKLSEEPEYKLNICQVSEKKPNLLFLNFPLWINRKNI